MRWAQANAFMPALQFHFAWDYDEEVTELCQEVTKLHAHFTPLLLNLAQEATVSCGSLMMRPTWWLCPTLEECLTADQQFLVGDDLLVGASGEAHRCRQSGCGASW